MEEMSLLIVSTKIQIQKPHMHWPPQNPSLYNPSFFIDSYNAYGSIWLLRKSRKSKEKSWFSVLCYVCSLNLILFFYRFLHLDQTSGCYYFDLIAIVVWVFFQQPNSEIGIGCDDFDILSVCLDSNYKQLRLRFLTFFFFFGFPTALFDQVNCEQYTYALFMDPQIPLFSNFFIKNGSHGTIYTFKNYFTIVLSVSAKISSI